MQDSTVMLLVRDLEVILQARNPSLHLEDRHRLELARLLENSGPASFMDLLEKVFFLADSVSDPDSLILQINPQWTELRPTE